MSKSRNPLTGHRVTRRAVLAALGGAAATVVLASCGAPATTPTAAPAVPPKPQPTVAPASAPGAPKAPEPTADAGIQLAPEPNPKRGGVLTYVGDATTPHFDIYQGGVEMLAVTYDGLVAKKIADGLKTVIPQLATKWEIAPDGKTVTFYLRKDVKFSDGSPFTAADVVATFTRVINPPSGMVSIFKNFYGPLSSIEAVDPMTVRFSFSKPYFPFMDVMAGLTGSIMSKAWLEKNDPRKTAPIGTGPFIFKDYKEGEGWWFDRNPNYWNKQIPYVDGLRYVLVQNMNDRGTAVMTLRGDWAANAGRESWLAAEGKPGVMRGLTKNQVRNTLIINCAKKPFDDPRVRRAMKLACPYPDMVALGGNYEAVTYNRWVGASDPFEMPEAEIKKLPGWRADKTEDVALAKKLMAEAGYADGIKDVDLMAWPDHINYNLAVAYQDWLKRQLNIGCNLRNVTRTVEIEDEQNGNFTLSMNYKSPAPVTDLGVQAQLFWKTGAPDNAGKYSNPKVDNLADQIVAELDIQKRTALIRQLEDVLDEDPPWVPNGCSSHGLMWRDYVKGLSLEKRVVTSKSDLDTAWLDK